MPVITITLIEGYNEETRRNLSQRLTDAARSVIAAPLDGVTVVINEVAAPNYMRGRQGRTPGEPKPNAEEIVRTYLSAMQARDLDAAGQWLAPGFTMIFPGGIEFTHTEQLVSWAKDRYQTIGKTYERFEECYGVDETIVYCSGTMHGMWPNGEAFSEIRFIDRFVVRDGLLASQIVWNDLAEMKP